MLAECGSEDKAQNINFETAGWSGVSDASGIVGLVFTC